MCDEYFRPGAAPHLDASRDRSGIDVGETEVGETKGDQEPEQVQAPETSGGPGFDENSRGGVGGEATAALRDANMRADYMNSRNAFNQLPVG